MNDDSYTLSSAEAAKAELRELREVAEEMAEALRACSSALDGAEDGIFWDRVADAEAALARYEALRDG